MAKNLVRDIGRMTYSVVCRLIEKNSRAVDLYRLELHKFVNFCVAHLPVNREIKRNSRLTYFGHACPKYMKYMK